MALPFIGKKKIEIHLVMIFLLHFQIVGVNILEDYVREIKPNSQDLNALPIFNAGLIKVNHSKNS